jgi:hypothetical protein
MFFDYARFMVYTAKLTKTLAMTALILFFAAAPSRAENFVRLATNHADAAS